jgi:chemotaxis protein MotB
MADDSQLQPIIIKRVTNVAAGHHGGAWKVAYADFVTAMMAFFLLLWLVNVTTDEQKSGLADYFAPTTLSLSRSGAGGVLAGRTFAPDGARIGEGAPPTAIAEIGPPPAGPQARDATDEEIADLVAEREQAEFDAAQASLGAAMEANPEIAALKDNVIIDMTPAGMRIQLVDKEGGSMFAAGGAAMPARTRELLAEITRVISELPNDLRISGHTDAEPFGAANGDTNWELSSDRANASRRVITESGFPVHRVREVVGKADSDPLTPEDPFLPENRRISLILLRNSPVLPPDMR